MRFKYSALVFLIVVVDSIDSVECINLLLMLLNITHNYPRFFYLIVVFLGFIKHRKVNTTTEMPSYTKEPKEL